MANTLAPLGMEGLGMMASGDDDDANRRLLEWWLKFNARRKVVDASKRQQEAIQSQENDRSVRSAILHQAQEDVMAPIREVGGGVDKEGNPISQDQIAKAIQDRYHSYLNMYAANGLLPSVVQPEQEEAPASYGSGSITLEEDVAASGYKRGTKAIQTPNGHQVIVEPVKWGKDANGKEVVETYKIKSRNIDAQGNHRWLQRGTITQDDLNKYAFGEWYDPGQKKESKKQGAKPKKAVETTTTPVSEKKKEFPEKQEEKPKTGMVPPAVKESQARNEARANLDKPLEINLGRGLQALHPNKAMLPSMASNPQPLTEAIKTLPRNEAMDAQARFIADRILNSTDRPIDYDKDEPDLW